AEAVALGAAQRHFQIVPRRQLIFVDQDWAAAGLADDEVELARVAEVGGDDRAAVAVVVGAADETEVEEVSPADRAGHVQEETLALVRAEVVALLENLPGPLHPELAQRGVELARRADFPVAVVRL